MFNYYHWSYLNMTKEFGEISCFQRLLFNENPNVGVFCRANENVCFIMKHLTKKIKRKVSNALGVKLVETTIAEANIIGSLLSINSHGAVITDLADEEINGYIVDQGLNIFVIDDKINAAGNIILVNDYGALVHPDFKDSTINIPSIFPF